MIDLLGLAYWSTSDPAQIYEFLRNFHKNDGKVIFTGWMFGWDHTTDMDLLGGLVYDDELDQYYFTSGHTAQDGTIIITLRILRGGYASDSGTIEFQAPRSWGRRFIDTWAPVWSYAVLADRAWKGGEYFDWAGYMLLGVADGIALGTLSMEGVAMKGAVVRSAVTAVEQSSTWVYGAFKSNEKWARQMAQRGWTEQQITEAITHGKAFKVVNNVNKVNGATRYVHPTTGRSIVRDDVTKELLQVGGDGFLW